MLIGLTGCILLGKHKYLGWLCYAIASGINGYLGFSAGFIGMGLGSMIYCFLEIKNYIEHHRKKK